MEMQPLSTNKINNGMKHLIERHSGLANSYVYGVKRVLRQWIAEGKPGAKMYQRTAIWRIVNDRVEISDRNKIVKEAFMNVFDELYPNTTTSQCATVEPAMA
jgi:hypothetical protein